MIHFSVVIPIFNRANTISVTLDSLCNQTYKYFEVIIVDDFSSDFKDLRKVVDEYKELDIKLVRHDKNKNGAAARNTGIRSSTGEFIAFLDSDDSWSIDKLQVCNSYIMSDPASKETIYYSKLRVDKLMDSTVRPEIPIGEGENVSEYIFCNDGLIQTSTIVLNRELAGRILFDERFIRHQDYDFVLRAQSECQCKFDMIDQVLTYYSSDVNAVSRSISLGESVKYSEYWLNEMLTHMTTEAVNCYRFFYLSKKIRREKKYIKLLFVLISSYFKMNRRNRLKARKLLKSQFLL